MTRSLDVFCHLLTPRFCEEALKACSTPPLMWTRARHIPVMVDLSARIDLMDRFPGYCQIPSLAAPPIEVLAGPDISPSLARIANEEMAEMTRDHPDRFPGFVASLPLNNPKACLEEAPYCLDHLGAVGVQVFTNVLGAPIDRPEYLDIFRFMGERDLPVWLHPARGMKTADYAEEEFSKFESWWVLGWPYESSLAMYRLVFSGIFEEYPDLKVVTHHAGGMIPMMAGRLGPGLELYGTRTPETQSSVIQTPLKEKPLEAMKRFHADTATFGSGSAISCGLEFFGVDRMLFASDMPFDPEKGPGYIRSTLEALAALPISDQDREAILWGNAERLLWPRNSAGVAGREDLRGAGEGPLS